MNQSDRDEMLIRIDQKVVAIEAVIFGEPKYSSIKEKVLNHSKIFWLALSASFVAVVKSFWSS